MHVELYCRTCQSRFATAAETPATAGLDWTSEASPWNALGDGETFEDALAAALSDRGADLCPHCGEAATVSEESLGRLSLELLGTW